MRKGPGDRDEEKLREVFKEKVENGKVYWLVLPTPLPLPL
jgi:hypothetical protein